MLIETLLPDRVDRVLDLGTGDGRLIRRVMDRLGSIDCVGIDISDELLEVARERLADDSRIKLRQHDMSDALPADLGTFNLVVSGLAIHHLSDERKRELYGEVFTLLRPGGAFYNFDVTLPPTDALAALANREFGFEEMDEDPSDQLAPLEVQIDWLREIGYQDVDCHWKWLKLSLFGGMKPAS